MKPKLLFLWPGAAKDRYRMVERLTDHFEIIKTDAYDEQSLMKLIPRAAVVVGTRISRPLCEAAEKLKFLQTPSAGVNGLDLAALDERGAIVCNSHSHAPFVAEHGVTMLLTLMKKVAVHDRLMRNGVWYGPGGTSRDETYQSDTLIGSTVGFIGFGHIGREILSLLSGFKVKALAGVRSIDGHAEDLNRFPNLEFAGLDRVLENSDAIFLTVPLTGETEGMIGAAQISRMKSSVYLINVARAGIVDADALLDALVENSIRGSAIDAWEKEKASAHDFAKLDNMILSPHRAGTHRDITPYLHDVVDNLIAFATGIELRNRVDLKAGY